MVVIALAGNSGTSVWSAPDLGITAGFNNLYNTVVNTNIFGISSLATSGAAGYCFLHAVAKMRGKEKFSSSLTIGTGAALMSYLLTEYSRDTAVTVGQKVALGVAGAAAGALPLVLPTAREWFRNRPVIFGGIGTMASQAAAAAAKKKDQGTDPINKSE